MKNKILLFMVTLIALGVIMTPEAKAADTLTDTTTVTTTIPHVVNVIMPATANIDLSGLTFSDFGVAAQGTNVAVIGDGASNTARIETNKAPTSVTLSIADGTDTTVTTAAVPNNYFIATSTAAGATNTAVSFQVEATDGAGPAEYTDGTTPVAFNNLTGSDTSPIDTTLSAALPMTNDGDSFLDLQFDLDETTLDVQDDADVVIEFDVTVTVVK